MQYLVSVLEEYDDDVTAPEEFGEVRLEKLPIVGDVIGLTWLDGKPAYEAVVTACPSMLRVRVKRIPAPV